MDWNGKLAILAPKNTMRLRVCQSSSLPKERRRKLVEQGARERERDRELIGDWRGKALLLKR